MALVIHTQNEQVLLRQLDSEADDLAYFAAIDANREHLSQFGDETAAKYATLEDVCEVRLNPTNPDKLRMGIWNTDDFVGSVNLTPDKYGGAEVGYWLDARHTGHGYATLATRAITQHALKRYSSVYAYVTEGNRASEAVLERAGYQVVAQKAGRLIFVASGINEPKATVQQVKISEIIAPDLERFGDMPNRRQALRAKDKDNLAVFLSFGVAKKLYRCPCCNGDIAIGTTHAIMSRVQMSKRYTHHHIDFSCIQETILPALSDIKVIKPEEASAAAVNARNRNYRNKKRR